MGSIRKFYKRITLKSLAAPSRPVDWFVESPNILVRQNHDCQGDNAGKNRDSAQDDSDSFPQISAVRLKRQARATNRDLFEPYLISVDFHKIIHPFNPPFQMPC